MGLPAKLNMKLYRGDTRHWTTTFADGEDPLDLSGHTWLCQIREDDDRGEILATLDVDDTDAATGTIVRTLPAAEADALLPTDPEDPDSLYYWDLQSTSGDGDVQTWLYGSVTVLGDASDA